MPPMLPSGRWALTPPFHPYQALSPSAIRLRGLLSGRLKVFLQMATEARCTGGLFSVALSVAGNFASLARTARRAGPLALPGALPFSLRRPAPKTFVPGVKREDHGVRTFLPAGLLAKDDPAITRLARLFELYNGDAPTSGSKKRAYIVVNRFTWYFLAPQRGFLMRIHFRPALAKTGKEGKRGRPTAPPKLFLYQ